MGLFGKVEGAFRSLFGNQLCVGGHMAILIDGFEEIADSNIYPLFSKSPVDTDVEHELFEFECGLVEVAKVGIKTFAHRVGTGHDGIDINAQLLRVGLDVGPQVFNLGARIG